MKRLFTVIGFIVLCSVLSSGQVSHKAANCSGQGTSTSGSNAWTFSCTANATNDAVVFIVGCTPTSGTPSGVTLAATGWTITSLSGVKTSGTYSAATFAALAPNTSAATFTATFTGVANCTNFTNHLHDEFSGNDTTGGTTTFYGHIEATATGCSGQAVTSASANDAVWGACTDSLPTTNWQGAGWSQGVNDLQGDATVFKVASGAQTPAWATSSGGTVNASVGIKASGGAAVVRHRAWVIN